MPESSSMVLPLLSSIILRVTVPSGSPGILSSEQEETPTANAASSSGRRSFFISKSSCVKCSRGKYTQKTALTPIILHISLIASSRDDNPTISNSSPLNGHTPVPQLRSSERHNFLAVFSIRSRNISRL